MVCLSYTEVTLNLNVSRCKYIYTFTVAQAAHILYEKRENYLPSLYIPKHTQISKFNENTVLRPYFHNVSLSPSRTHTDFSKKKKKKNYPPILFNHPVVVSFLDCTLRLKMLLFELVF